MLPRRSPQSMKLKTVFVRFYKSFNYDYLRKNHPAAERAPWDVMDNSFYPFVRIPMDSKITTIVGANESGKSHLLSAIEKGISGLDIRSEDFCRYSQFFGVLEGQVRSPDFGFEWSEFTEDEHKSFRELTEMAITQHFDSLFLFRTNSKQLKMYVPKGTEYAIYEVEESKIAKLLPRTFRIDAQVALPDSVPIRELANEISPSSRQELLGRERRFAAVETVETLFNNTQWFQSQEKLQNSSSSIFPVLSRLFTKIESEPDKEARQREAQLQLAKDLICKVAKIDKLALKQLYEALRSGSEGHVNGLIERINKALATRLNFPKMWVQDRDFSLRVSPREFDLVFTIRDRTGTEYSFNERSSGLKYFLSYYIQYLAHESQGPGTEILLMDEPDAYLSSQAQQDLLRVFAAFAEPEADRRPVQVVFVTHSPFLIDKNNADRIRVLEKGVGDEGTRVVRDVSRNHYEPLRSAFGAFVAETTFIGNCNLMVEGPADQVLLAGTASYLRSRGVPEFETLDLNRLTIVPAGSSSHVPYLVYLARGRDVERPAIVVLLDSDKAGNQAKKDLARGGPKGRELLKPRFILQIADLPTSRLLGLPGPATEVEDLIPPALAVSALSRYAKEFWSAEDFQAATLPVEALTQTIQAGLPLFDALTQEVKKRGDDLHVDKIGFARAVVQCVTSELELDPQTRDFFENNMKVLFRRLREIQRDAQKELSEHRVTQKIDRLKNTFLQDFPTAASREQANWFLHEVEDALDGSSASDAIQITIHKLRRDAKLTEDELEPVEDFSEFRNALEQIKYAGRIATQDG